MIDPRILTGPAQLIIGIFLLTISARLWLVHPVNRVLRLGPFVTADGLSAVIRMRIIFLAFGLFFVINAVSNMNFWWFAHADPDAFSVRVLGSASAGLALWCAFKCLIMAVRLWRLR